MKKTLALILLLAGLSGEVRAVTLIWNGSWNDMTWNTENGNWLLNGAHAVYANGNDVVFGDTGNGFVSLSGELAPSSVLVKSDNYYFFCSDIGEGNKLTGTMQLTKEGEGELTIQTANDYTGGTLIKGGTLVMGNANALGSGIVSMSGATLDLGGHTLSNTVSVQGSVAVHSRNGSRIDGDISLEEGAVLTLYSGDLSGSGTITLNDSAMLNIGTHTLSKNVTLNGTSTVKAENTTIKALNTDKEGLMQALRVSDGLIAGTDRQASQADGLDICRMGQGLKLENLVLTANNKISVGEHTITLKDVTIKISDDVCTLLNGIYTIDLKSLINCDLEMQNVLLDASDLTLPEGFDPATTSVVFDFGDDVTITQATGLDMRLGNYWSPSLNLDQQGKIIFTKLVPTPEPATGTLSLLALAALAARRRK